MKEYLFTVTGAGKVEGTNGVTLMQYEHRVTSIAIDLSAFIESFHQKVLCASVAVIVENKRSDCLVGAIPDSDGKIYWEPSAADTRTSGTMNIVITVLFAQGREARSESATLKIITAQRSGEDSLSLGAQAALAGMCEVRFSAVSGNLLNWGGTKQTNALSRWISSITAKSGVGLAMRRLARKGRPALPTPRKISV